MKRIIASLLIVVILLGSLTGCEHFRFENDTSVTRGQWITLLAAAFGLEDYQEEEAHFSDIDSKDEIFDYVQACYEWDVLRDISKKFKKNDRATLEFVVTTAVYTIEVDLSDYEGNNDLEKALDYASKEEILPAGFKKDEWATTEQCEYVLSKAQDGYLNFGDEPVEKAVMHDTVNDQTETGNIIALDENSYQVHNVEPEVGEIIVAPGTEKSPEGVAIKVETVTPNADGTYTIETVTPEVYEVFEELEYAGTAVPEFDDIIPAEGVTLTEGIQATQMNLNGSKNEMIDLGTSSTGSMLQTDIGTNEKNALSFTAECNFTKGKVSLSPAWGNVSSNIEQLIPGEHAGTASPEAGQFFEKTGIFPDKDIFGSSTYKSDKAIDAYQKGALTADELKKVLESEQDKNGIEKKPTKVMEGKFSGGYEIVGSIGIQDLYIKPTYKIKTKKVFGVDTGIPCGMNKVSVETNYKAEVSLSLKGKLDAELTVLNVPVALGGTPVILTVELKLYMDVNGELAVKASIANNTKIEWNDGKTKKTTKQTSSASVDGQISVEAGPKISATLSALGIKIVNANLSAGILVELNLGIAYNTEWTETEDAFIIDRKTNMYAEVIGHIAIVKASLGSDESTLANKLNINFTWTIIGKNGGNTKFQALKFEILPKKEYIVWQDHQEIPKDPDENEPEIDESQEQEEMSKGNLGISTFYVHLMEGESKTVKVTYPEDYTKKDFTWSSSDTSVASVSNGKIKGKKVGTAMITVESKDGKYKASCAVYVGEKE